MRCRVCGNDQGNRAYEAREMMFGRQDVFRYFQCAQCMCLQIEEFPANLSSYYPDGYYSYQPVSSRSAVRRFLIRLRDRYAVWGKGYLGRLLYSRWPVGNVRCLSALAIQKDTAILDVGCGGGALLHSLRELGMQNLLGIDPFNPEDVQYDNGLVVQKKDIHGVDGQWDIVMFHHSFEHIPNPAETLQAVAGLLKPNGHCVIRVPLATSFAWEHYGVDWVQLDAPRHLYLYSPESMRILSEQAGLDVWKVVYDSTAFQFWGSEQYAKGMALEDPRSYAVDPKASIFSQKDIRAFARRARNLNETGQGDQAAFYLRKACCGW